MEIATAISASTAKGIIISKKNAGSNNRRINPALMCKDANTAQKGTYKKNKHKKKPHQSQL